MINKLQWIIGKTIKSVYAYRDKNYNDNIISVFFNIENRVLFLKVDEETDTIILSDLIDADKNYKNEIFFDELFVNKKIISFWLPKNNLGYNDTFLLGLNKFIPTHVFSTVTSCVKIGSITY